MYCTTGLLAMIHAAPQHLPLAAVEHTCGCTMSLVRYETRKRLC